MRILRFLRVFVVLLLWAAGTLLPAQGPQADQWNGYVGTKSYRLRLTWTAGDDWTKTEEQGNCIVTKTLQANLGASAFFKLVRSERGHGRHALWLPEKGSKPQGSLSYRLNSEERQQCRDKPESPPSTITWSGGGIGPGDARFELDTQTGEYRIFGYVDAAQGSITMVGHTFPGALNLNTSPRDKPGPSDIVGTATPGGKSLQGIPIETAGDPVGSASRKPTILTWSLDPWEEDQDEMLFDVQPDYDQWIPAARPEDLPGIALSPDEDPWKPLMVKVRIVTKKDGNTGRSGKIRFTLEEVSKNHGYCLNFPPKGQEKADLRFSDQQMPGITLSGKDSDVAETDDAVAEATVRVESRDPGAYGTLKAACADLNLKAMYKPTNTYALAIPRDDDGNHIADAWETKKGIPHYDKDWDGESVPGQDQAGDGLTLYHEYRGAVVLDGGKKTWRRLDPAKKEMFLVDPGGVFPLAVWERVTQIKAYALDDSLVDASLHSSNGKSPLVNFNALDFSSHPVYALLVKVRSDNPSESDAPAYAEWNEPACIKNAIQINLFPARFTARIEEDYQWLNKAVLDPDSQQASELAHPPDTLPSTFPQDGKQAWSKLALPATRQAIAAKLQTAVFLHETGHILGTPDHDTSPPAGLEFIRNCLSFNEGPWFRRGTLIYTVLGQGDKDLAWPYLNFCKTSTPTYNCFGVLHVKDW